jgi:hypothetical protein
LIYLNFPSNLTGGVASNDELKSIADVILKKAPPKLAYLHDWSVVEVPNGFDFTQIAWAHQRAIDLEYGQPTAIVYRTTKGWKYGLEGKAFHAAGHKPRLGKPRAGMAYGLAHHYVQDFLETCILKVGTSTTLRQELGRVLHYLNEKSGVSLLVSAADLLGSKSVNAVATIW